jgi:hypothetical protein
MTVTGSAPTQLAHDEPQALFPEARRRRRRRWVIGAGVLILVLAAALALISSSGSERSAPSHRSARHDGLVRWAPPPGATASVPPVFVAGDGKGGAGVYSTAKGKLIRTLSPQGPGGPDQQVVLSGDRRYVYFSQPTGPGACNADILSVPTSGTSAPTVVISDPGTIALAPSPNPASAELAWVGVTCSPSGFVTSYTLYVTNLATHATSDLGAFAGRSSDNEMAWSSDGRRLAVQNGSTVEVFEATQLSSQTGQPLRVATGCSLSSPVLLPRANELAAIRTCYSSAGRLRSSQALVFNVATGNPVALIASAPDGSIFQGLSLDASGQHFLLGLVASFPASATNVQVARGRLVVISHEAPTDAEW